MEKINNKYINNYFKNKLKQNKSYTYEQASIDVKKELTYLLDKKLLEFNKNIEYNYDNNGIPKLIHFTCKDKTNINNDIWKQCLDKYYILYPDSPSSSIFDNRMLISTDSGVWDHKSVGVLNVVDVIFCSNKINMCFLRIRKN